MQFCNEIFFTINTINTNFILQKYYIYKLALETTNHGPIIGGCYNYSKRQIIYLAIERNFFLWNTMAWFISPTNSYTHCCKQGDTFLSCERSIEKVLCSIYKDVCYMLRWCIKPEFQKIDYIFLVIDIVEHIWILLETN